MTSPRSGGLLVLGGLLSSVMLGVGTLSPVPADAANPSLSSTAAATTTPGDESIPEPVAEPGDQVVIDTPALEAAPSVQLSGDIIVSVSETPSLDPDVEGTVEYRYAVETAGGAVVPIDGEIPETVVTGDQFAGAVAVDTTVVEHLTPEAAIEVEASAGAESVAEQSASTQEVIAAASATGSELPVVDAQVTVAAIETAGAALRHEIVLVANTPPGTVAITQSDASLRSLATSSATHWRDESNGLIPQFAVNSTVTRTFDGSCAEDPWVTWDRAATRLGYDNWRHFKASSPAGTTRHLVVINSATCTQSGVGIVGSSLHYGGAVRQSAGSAVPLSTLAHELGHNLGLGHSNLHVCTGSSCTNHEYWDLHDVMGLGVVDHDTLTPLNTSTGSRLGFVPATATQGISLPAGASSKTFTVSLSKLSGTTGIRQLKVTDPNTGQLFHVELRSGAGDPKAPYYAHSPTYSFSGKSVSFTPGVRMLRATGNGSAVIAHGQAGGTYRTAAQAGQSLQSPSGGITVTAVSGSPSSAMQVSVRLGAVTAAADGSMPIYRFWSDAYQGHFYTASEAEKNKIIATYPAHVWKYEAVAYRAFTKQVPGTVPLYRFWSQTMNGHFFTASVAEKNAVIANYDDSVWKYESIAYYVYPPSSAAASSTAVYRFWSDTYRHHFYTASLAERNNVISAYDDRVWKYEAVAYKVPGA